MEEDSQRDDAVERVKEIVGVIEDKLHAIDGDSPKEVERQKNRIRKEMKALNLELATLEKQHSVRDQPRVLQILEQARNA